MCVALFDGMLAFFVLIQNCDLIVGFNNNNSNEVYYAFSFGVDFVRQPETFKLVRFVARIVEWTEDNIFAKG